MVTPDAGQMPSRDSLDELIAAADLAHEGDEQAEITDRLAAVGVERVDAPTGSSFDPTLHRVVAMVPAAAPTDENTIDETVRPGWRLRGEMLRFVEVRVRVHPSRCPGSA
ncbi:nucleotide exchange factor GrpE [Rhodococcus yananensis]|uniref:nucleotide exchange factor GrpE n=1 Tax=Rhodococcus yananensis TaxID=2879464 RepID=UPI003EB6AAC0